MMMMTNHKKLAPLHLVLVGHAMAGFGIAFAADAPRMLDAHRTGAPRSSSQGCGPRVDIVGPTALALGRRCSS